MELKIIILIEITEELEKQVHHDLSCMWTAKIECHGVESSIRFSEARYFSGCVRMRKV
jgi:hypothetical protein